MKILFFVLALANVLVVMWEYHKGVLGAAPGIAVDNSKAYQEQITLVSELAANTVIANQADKPQTSAEPNSDSLVVMNQLTELTHRTESGSTNSSEIRPEQSTTASVQDSGAIANLETLDVNSMVCYEAGPFSSKQVYWAWEKLLKDFMAGFNRESPELKDYVVYYPAAETMSQSQANLQMLKEKGMTDLWFFSQGSEQGQISLGLFNKEEKARLMQKELLAKGIAAEIKARYKNKVQKFAVIRTYAKLMDSLEILKKEYPTVLVNKLDPSLNNGCIKALKQ